MTPEEFEKNLQTHAKAIEKYATISFPTTAANVALRFINGNFRAGGFQGSTFKKWKGSKGTTLVKTGALRAANTYTAQNGQVTLKNNMPYAKVHNEGFKGTVAVKAHTRNTYATAKVGTGLFTKKGAERTQTVSSKVGEKQVKAHTRKVDIPQRQFMPINENDSPVLKNAIQRVVAKDLEKLFKS